MVIIWSVNNEKMVISVLDGFYYVQLFNELGEFVVDFKFSSDNFKTFIANLETWYFLEFENDMKATTIFKDAYNDTMELVLGIDTFSIEIEVYSRGNLIKKCLCFKTNKLGKFIADLKELGKFE